MSINIKWKQTHSFATAALGYHCWNGLHNSDMINPRFQTGDHSASMLQRAEQRWTENDIHCSEEARSCEMDQTSGILGAPIPSYPTHYLGKLILRTPTRPPLKHPIEPLVAFLFSETSKTWFRHPGASRPNARSTAPFACRAADGCQAVPILGMASQRDDKSWTKHMKKHVAIAAHSF